jgi:alpha-N-acetylglucosamine transferase
MRHLLYFAIGGNNYVPVFKLAIDSVKRHLSRADVDILVIKDARTDVDWPLVHNVDESIHPSLYRLEIDNFKNVHLYDKILYIDADVLATKMIDPIFDEPFLHNRLYTCQQGGDDYDSNYVCLSKFSEETKSKLKEKKCLPFYNGQFLFRYSKDMILHFERVKALSRTIPDNLIYKDQKAMNYYFNSEMINCVDILDKYFMMFAKRDTNAGDYVFLHFCGCFFDSEFKMREMVGYIKNNDNA